MFVALLSLLRAWCVGASVVSSASYLRAFAQVQTAVSLFVVQRVRRRWFCAWLRVVTASTPMWETRTHARTRTCKYPRWARFCSTFARFLANRCLCKPPCRLVPSQSSICGFYTAAWWVSNLPVQICLCARCYVQPMCVCTDSYVLLPQANNADKERHLLYMSYVDAS